MAIIPGILPPSRENWEWIVFLFQFFPVFTLVQWAQLFGLLPQWYSMGKTSTTSRWNLPGRVAWLTMEIPGMLTVIYILYALPSQLGVTLQRDNYIMAGLYCIHYTYRAIISPIIAPSMSPIHILVWLSAFSFQVINGISIGGWLGGHGHVTREEWSNYGIKGPYWASARMELGLMIFGVSLLVNIFHDNELREIRWAKRRVEAKRLAAAAAEDSTGKSKSANAKVSVDKFYMIPKNGGYWYILYPHYLAEWVEWFGYCVVGGPKFVPGRVFLVNEIATMLPRAIEGKQWYLERFGKDKLAGRKAIIPGIL